MATTFPASPAFSPRAATGPRTSAPVRLACLLGLVALAALAGFVATPQAEAARAVAGAGAELTRLLRAMALLKTVFAGAAVSVVAWRLVAPASLGRLALYGLACAAMAAGPGLIWDMAHVRLGAAALHGGLLASVLLLWRDPATALRLRQAIATRRTRLAHTTDN